MSPATPLTETTVIGPGTRDRNGSSSPEGDLPITTLRLEGENISAQVLDTVVDGDIDMSIESSSTVTLTLHDPGPEYVMLNSGLYVENNPLILSMPDPIVLPIADPKEKPIKHPLSSQHGNPFSPKTLRFALTHVEKNGDEQTLTFEDEIIYWFSQYNVHVKAARSKVTRAQFILARMNEVKEITFPYFMPEVNIVQPISATPKRSTTETTSSRDDSRTGGFHSNSNVKVKQSKANPTQLRCLSTVLDVCSSFNEPRDIMVMAVMCVVDETNAGIEGVHTSINDGVFQRGVGHSKGIEGDTRDWLKGGKDFQGGGMERVYAAHHGKMSFTNMIHLVQQNADAGVYEQFKAEAENTVRAYGGGSDTGSTTTETSERRKRYEFSRGRPGGPVGENTYGMAMRLAEEVKWRFFVSQGTVYYISEPRLLASRPRLLITPETDGIEEVDFGWNVTSKKDIPPSELTITARADRFGVPPGAVIELDGYGEGIANGFWLVSNVSRGLYDSECTITCKQPSNPRDEPAPETTTVTHTSQSSAASGVSPILPDGYTSLGGFTGQGAGHGGVDMGTNGPKIFHAPIKSVVIDQRHDGWWGGHGPQADGGAGVTRLKALDSVGICKRGTILGYGHGGNANVKVGDTVTAGQSIGRVANANAYHIHFFVGPPGSDARDGVFDPQPYIDLFQGRKGH